MASSRGYRPKTQAPLARSNSEQLLLRKRQDLNYLDVPTSSSRPTARDRKALSDAAEASMLAQQQQQRARSGTAVISSRGNDQGSSLSGGPFRLNRKEKLFLIKRAKESAVALIDHAHTLDGPIQWHYKGKHRGIQMYRGEGLIEGGGVGAAPGTAMGSNQTGDQALEFLCGVTTMMGTLEEVSEYFDQATTARMKMKKAEDVMDCAVLYSLVWGNTVNPFHRVSVKYTAYDGPAAMTRPRDFCFLECQDTFRHSSGRRGWVLSMHSIKIPSCPEVPGFVRGSVYHSGFVFVESERPGYMDVMYSLQINFKGHGRVPQFMLNASLKRRLRELIHISREIQVARMAHRTLLQEKDLMPKSTRDTCLSCSRRFWLLLRKTRCRVCGEVVCQSCAPLVDFEGAGSNGQHTKTRICVKCYSTAPTNGSWTAPNEGLPWTEQSRMLDFEKQTSMPQLPPHRSMFRVKEESGDEDNDQDDDDEEGRYTFAELEEQSSHSVFAPERFTRSSMASIAPLQIDEIGVDYDAADRDEDDSSSLQSGDYQWNERSTEESVFNIGSLSSSVMSRDSYFGRPDPAPPAPSMRYSSRHNPLNSVPDDTPILMEEPEANQVSHVNNHRISRRFSTPAPAPTRPPVAAAKTTQPPPPSSSPEESKSSYEFLDGLIDLPLTKRSELMNADGTRKRAQTTIRAAGPNRNELNPSTLRAHNLRYLRGFEHETPASSRISFANQPRNTPPTPEETSQLPRRSDVPVSLDDIVPNNSLPSSEAISRNSGATSVGDNSLFARPSSLILQQVRKNRSRTIHLQSQPEDEFRTTKEIEDKHEEHRKRMEELNQLAIQYTGNRVSNLEITRPSLKPDPVDDEAWQSASRLEEYQNRRKNTIEALRKKAMSMQEDNRESSGTARTSASSPSFTGIQRIGEAALERSPSVTLAKTYTAGSNGNAGYLQRRSSTSSITQSPAFAGNKLISKPSEVNMRGMSEDLMFKPSFSLDTEEMKQYVVPEEGSEVDVDEYKLSRGSKDSVPDAEGEPEPESMGAMPSPKQAAHKEFVTPRSLYAEIGHLTQLHSEIAMAEDKTEVERIKDRIQEQYQLLRHMQLKP